MAPAPLREGFFRLFRFNAIAFVVQLATSAVVARVMGPEAMGLWLLLTLLPTYAEGFGRLKVDLAAVYFLGQGRWGLGEVSMALNVISLACSGAIVIVLLAIEPWMLLWLFDDKAVDPLMYRLVLLSIPLHFLALGYAYLLLHFEDVGSYNFQAFLRTILPSLLASMLLVTTPLRVEALVSSLLLGSVLGLVFSAWKTHKREGLRWRHKPGLYGALLGYGRNLYVTGVIEHLNLYLSALVVGVNLKLEELAFFRLGQARVQILDQLPSSVNTLLFPRFTKMTDVQAQRELVSKSIRVLFVLMGCCGILAAIVAPLAVSILYGSEFLPMVWVMWILLPGICALGSTSPILQYFMGRGRPDLLWKLALVPLVCQVAAIVPAMTVAGFRGAAAVVSVSFVICATVRIVALAKFSNQRPHVLCMPRREDLTTIIEFASERLRPFLKKNLPRPRIATRDVD